MTKWYIQHSAPNPYMRDEFIEGNFRLILSGATLEVMIEGISETAEILERAESLANNYNESLGTTLGERRTLVTDAHLCGLPPWANVPPPMVNSALRDHAERLARNIPCALRDARHSVTTYQWPLATCYDYWQNGQERDDQLFPALYKMVETMEHKVGGERSLITDSNLKRQVKFLKQSANHPLYDERHAPKDQAVSQKPPDALRYQAHVFAMQLLRWFEEMCRSKGLAGALDRPL